MPLHLPFKMQDIQNDQVHLSQAQEDLALIHKVKERCKEFGAYMGKTQKRLDNIKINNRGLTPNMRMRLNNDLRLFNFLNCIGMTGAGKIDQVLDGAHMVFENADSNDPQCFTQLRDMVLSPYHHWMDSHYKKDRVASFGVDGFVFPFTLVGLAKKDGKEFSWMQAERFGARGLTQLKHLVAFFTYQLSGFGIEQNSGGRLPIRISHDAVKRIQIGPTGRTANNDHNPLVVELTRQENERQEAQEAEKKELEQQNLLVDAKEPAKAATTGKLPKVVQEILKTHSSSQDLTPTTLGRA